MQNIIKMTKPILTAKSDKQMSTLRWVLLFGLLIFMAYPAAPLYSVTPSKVKSESTCLSKSDQKKALKTKKKVGRKVDKLKKKLEELREINEEGKKGKGLAIAGGIILLIGLILILTGTSDGNKEPDSIGDGAVSVLNGCFAVLVGLTLSVTGMILLIVGLIV